MRLSRRAFLRRTAILSAGAVCSYGFCIEPSWLKLEHHVVALPKGISVAGRILHLADLHYGPHMPIYFIERAFDLGLSMRPEVVLVTGDFIHRRLSNEAPLGALFSRLTKAIPIYATVGNHDGGAWARKVGGLPDSLEVREFLSRNGVRVLHNETIQHKLNHGKIELVGLGDTWAGEFLGKEAFTKPEAASARIVLSHNPDSKDLIEAQEWHLMLSGHTHGGQLRIPLSGETPFAPVKDLRFVAGLNPWKDRLIHTTRGVASTLGFRLNCRPEVSILDLVPTI